MNLLKKRREELHLTQRQVAEKAGMTAHVYQSYELELRVPNIYAAHRIAEALNSTTTELFIDNYCNTDTRL